MHVDKFIEQAIKKGQSLGFQVLDEAESVTFAVSEAEVLCCMVGIDSLVDHFGITKMSLFSAAFRAVGAIRIAEMLSLIAAAPEDCEKELTLANDLITSLDGYSYESIQSFVEKHLKSRRL